MKVLAQRSAPVSVFASAHHRSFTHCHAKPSFSQAPVFSAGLQRLLTATTPSASFKTHASYADPIPDALTVEASPLVNKEIVLFLFQLEMDAQLQRALTYEDYDMVQDIRKRREKVDRALAELSEKVKGPACGARCASRSAEFDIAPEALLTKVRLQEAIANENFQEAAELRDRLAALEARTKSQSEDANNVRALLSEPRFALGEMVVHTEKGYRGVVCGWDLACCETPEWQTVAGVSSLQRGSQQVFYHVLVDAADWPEDDDGQPPVAYVAEELLDAASLANFESLEPLDYTFAHPYSYYMFLGSDGHGNMIPCRQLRDKYQVQRKDVYPPWQEEEDSEDEDGGDDDGDNGGGNDNGSWGGGSTIPGIDMKSLE